MHNLTPNQAKVMRFYAKEAPDGWVLPFAQIDAGLGRPSVKRAVRQLAGLGYLRLATGFREDDGMIAGRGYMLTGNGEDWCCIYRASLRSPQRAKKSANG